MYYLISVEMYCIFSLCTSDYPIKGYIPGPLGINIRLALSGINNEESRRLILIPAESYLYCPINRVHYP